MKKLPGYKSFFGIMDFIVIFASFLMTVYYLRTETNLSFLEFFYSIRSLILVLFLLSLSFIVIFKYNGLYRINIILSRAAQTVNILKALYYGALQIVIVSLFIENNKLIDSRLILIVFLFIGGPLIYVVRVEIFRTLFTYLKSNSLRRNVLIVGDGKAGKLLAAKLLFENPLGLEIAGFLDDDLPIGSYVVGEKKVLGRISELEKIIKVYKVDEILIAIENESYEQFLNVVDKCKTLQTSVRITSELFDIVAKKLNIEKYIDIPIVDVAPHYQNNLTLFLKRSFDVLGAFFGLLILSPFMITIAILVKTTSKGPIFFKQKRIGLLGKEFDFYKFRSMHVLSGEDEERKKMMIDFMKNRKPESIDTKVINDSRITWIGNIIRKTSLDELPQFFNVLKGDMSLVGPRPCLPYEFENYDEWQRRRVSVIPGCTGVWQVWGRSSVSFKDSVVLDLYYINNMSPWFDLQLILQTIPTILFLRGAK
ncbi:MAG: sugar transferase [Ignavibacteriales bacterium]|nr:sugar transferase [Ignavibacteriales bacterium]